MKSLTDLVCKLTGATSVQLGKEIQSLWSGYGVIQRAKLVGVTPSNVVIKHVDITQAKSNRRGWGGDLSHQRKVTSYQVEKRFYENFAGRCDANCRIPTLIVAHEKANGSGWVIVLEDLDSAGFDQRKSQLAPEELHTCLHWLASFHAIFMDNSANGLWPVGTYWHLATRPDEYSAMPASPLKGFATEIDRRLNGAKYQTLVHGDAKVANFCFAKRETGQPNRIAAVDFQYVGRGCGMKDVAYLISSCLSEDEASENQDSLLAFYFKALANALRKHTRQIDYLELETEWRTLYPFAWADFCRFLSGWSPGHWKLNTYSQTITQSVVDQLSETDN